MNQNNPFHILLRRATVFNADFLFADSQSQNGKYPTKRFVDGNMKVAVNDMIICQYLFSKTLIRKKSHVDVVTDKQNQSDIFIMI